MGTGKTERPGPPRAEAPFPFPRAGAAGASAFAGRTLLRLPQGPTTRSHGTPRGDRYRPAGP